jgi:hypothetical protein
MTDQQKLIAMYCTSCGEVRVVRTKPDPSGTVVCSCGGWVGGNSDGAWNYAELPGKSVTLELLDQVRQEISEELGGVEELLADVHMDAGEHTKKVGLAQSIVDARLELQEWDRDAPVIDNMASELSSAIVQLADQEVRIKELEGIQPQRVVHRDPDLQRQFNELSKRMEKLETSTRQDWIDWVTKRINAHDSSIGQVQGIQTKEARRVDKVEALAKQADEEMFAQGVAEGVSHQLAALDAKVGRHQERIDGIDEYLGKKLGAVSERTEKALEEVFRDVAHTRDVVMIRLDTHKEMVDRFVEQARGLEEKVNTLRDLVGKHAEEHCALDGRDGKAIIELREQLNSVRAVMDEWQNRIFGAGSLTPSVAERVETLEHGQLQITGISAQVSGLSEQFDNVRSKIGTLVTAVQKEHDERVRQAVRHWDKLAEFREEFDGRLVVIAEDVEMLQNREG